MMESRSWRIAVYLLGIILASGLVGGLIGHAVARRQLEARDDPANWNEHVSREFDRLVKPTPEQAGKVQAHLDEAVRQLQQIRSEAIARSTNVIWHLVAQVEHELTPEQRHAFEAMKPKSSDLTLEVLKVSP
jgi:hypothetical protein